MRDCVSCGAKDSIIRATQLATQHYKSCMLNYPQPAYWCKECGEYFLDAWDRNISEPLIRKFQDSVDEFETRMK